MPKTQKPAHLTKLLSSALFSGFLSDLGELTKTGLTEDECNANKAWIKSIADAVTGMPEPLSPGKTILDRCNDIYKVYDIWNYPEKDPVHREMLRDKLRNSVRDLSLAYGKRIKFLEPLLDKVVYRGIYSATQVMLDKMPNKMRYVRRALSDFPVL
jgi:hypothetical protein